MLIAFLLSRIRRVRLEVRPPYLYLLLEVALDLLKDLLQYQLQLILYHHSCLVHLLHLEPISFCRFCHHALDRLQSLTLPLWMLLLLLHRLAVDRVLMISNHRVVSIRSVICAHSWIVLIDHSISSLLPYEELFPIISLLLILDGEVALEDLVETIVVLFHTPVGGELLTFLEIRQCARCCFVDGTDLVLTSTVNAQRTVISRVASSSLEIDRITLNAWHSYLRRLRRRNGLASFALIICNFISTYRLLHLLILTLLLHFHMLLLPVQCLSLSNLLFLLTILPRRVTAAVVVGMPWNLYYGLVFFSELLLELLIIDSDLLRIRGFRDCCWRWLTLLYCHDEVWDNRVSYCDGGCSTRLEIRLFNFNRLYLEGCSTALMYRGVLSIMEAWLPVNCEYPLRTLPSSVAVGIHCILVWRCFRSLVRLARAYRVLANIRTASLQRERMMLRRRLSLLWQW